MKEYTVKKCCHLIDWNNAETANVDCLNWHVNEAYNPRTYAQIMHDDDRIYLKMVSEDDHIFSAETNINGDVSDDSCMEMFMMPPGEDKDYFNLEINCAGIVHLGVGEGRNGRRMVSPDDIKRYLTVMITSAKDGTRGKWELVVIIDKELWKKMYGREFKCGRGKVNFFKCGSHAPVRHYLTWNSVLSSAPDFHRPECFGDVVFE